MKKISTNDKISTGFSAASIITAVIAIITIQPVFIVLSISSILCAICFFYYNSNSNDNRPIIGVGYVIAIKGEKKDSYLGVGDTVGVLEEAIIYRDEIRADECITRVNNIYVNYFTSWYKIRSPRRCLRK